MNVKVKASHVGVQCTNISTRYIWHKCFFLIACNWFDSWIGHMRKDSTGASGMSKGASLEFSQHIYIYIYIWAVDWNIFYFHPYLGKWSILTNVFQMGWNHQLDIHLKTVCHNLGTLWICLYPFCNFASLVLKIVPHQLHVHLAKTCFEKNCAHPYGPCFLCYPPPPPKKKKEKKLTWLAGTSHHECRCISCRKWGFSSQSC